MNEQQAIDRLRSALDEVVDDAHVVDADRPVGRRRSTWRSVARPLSVAAAIVVVLGAGVLVVTETDDGELQPGTSDTGHTAEPATPSTASEISVEGPEPAPSAGPLLVHGIVRSPDGTPVDGASVELTAEPRDEAMATMEKGDRYVMTTVTTVRTDADGRFEIRVPLRLLKPFISYGDYANFALLASDGDDWTVWYFPRDFRRNGSMIPVEEESVATEVTVPGTDGARATRDTVPTSTTVLTVETVVDGAPFVDLTLHDAN